MRGSNDDHVAEILKHFFAATDRAGRFGPFFFLGFGTFEVRSRKVREGRNPATGEAIKIEALKTPAFKAGKALRDKVK